MATTQKSKLFSLIILVGTLIGLILMIMDIYHTPINLITIIVVILLSITQIVVALNELVPKRYLSEGTAEIGLLCVGLTLVFLMMDGIEYAI